MYKWIIILLVCFIVFLLGLVYICTRVQKFGIKSKVISFIIVLFFVVLLSLLLNVTNAIIAVIHYLIVWLVMDLIFYIIKKNKKKIMLVGRRDFEDSANKIKNTNFIVTSGVSD